MDKTISFELSKDSVDKAIAELKKYRSDLDDKCKELCSKLCDAGIEIASGYVGDSGFGKYIHLSSEIAPEKAGCKAMFYMEDSQQIVSQWKTKEGVKSAVVSASAMLEFGAGLKAENPAGIAGMGTGTFPNGTHGNEPGWWYMDLDNVWHYSSGHEAHLPMYHAGQELRDKVIETAKGVFG